MADDRGVADEPGTVRHGMATTTHAPRTFTPAPTIRPVLTAALVTISLILVYEASRTATDGPNHSWNVAAALAGLFVARGVHLRRTFTLPHLTAALLVLVFAQAVYRTGHTGLGFVVLASTGFILVLPRGTKPQPDQLYRVAELIGRTEGDPLAPFALHSSKAYYFNASGTAAIAYRARFGVAVVAGDPIGERAAFAELLMEFSEFARNTGWRLAVLGASPQLAAMWRHRAIEHHGLHAIPVGRDVIIDVNTFAMVGRGFRNLRQAVSRTRNFGVTTEVISESALSEPLRAELLAIVDEWGRGRQNRGFSMILDHLLDGRNPGMLIVIARDEQGRVAGFQRYGMSSRGRELSLDVPWRRKDAPNGLDERMIIDLVDYAREQDIERISLAFAAFPEIFADKQRSRTAQLIYLLVHLGDPLIRLESLYRFLRKFHSLTDRRYVLIRWREIVVAAAALLTLEFLPHRRQY